MIVVIEEAGAQMVFDNVTRIQETVKSSVFSDAGRKVVYLFNGNTPLMGGDDIDPMTSKITVLPNAEKEDA
jgi:hypothetical protein